MILPNLILSVSPNKIIYALALATLFGACKNPQTPAAGETVKDDAFKPHALNPRYAKGFTVWENSSQVKLVCRNPDDTTQIYATYMLSKTGGKSDIGVPVKKLCITSTTHAFIFDCINANNVICGMSGMAYLQDSVLVKAYRQQNVAEVGKDDNLNREKIISIRPEAIMVYPYNGADYSDYEKAGITVIYNAEYLEQNPLGRAEWLKLAGLLTHKTNEAIAVFNGIEKKYAAVKQRVPKTIRATTIILGKPIDNNWFVPGSESFAAQLVKDAGCVYVFDEVKGNNVQSKSVEWVLANGAKADYWVFADYSLAPITKTSIGVQNKAFKHLNAFKSNHVAVCNSASNDYFGKGMIEPHIMLNDLIYVLYGGTELDSTVYFKPLQP